MLLKSSQISINISRAFPFGYFFIFGMTIIHYITSQPQRKPLKTRYIRQVHRLFSNLGTYTLITLTCYYPFYSFLGCTINQRHIPILSAPHQRQQLLYRLGRISAIFRLERRKLLEHFHKGFIQSVLNRKSRQCFLYFLLVTYRI